MNNLNKSQAISSLEIAEMMETQHREILKKLEGTKNPDGSVRQVGIIPVLTEGKIPVSDYFAQSTYADPSGKENKCYLITRMGCDFLANKFSGRKGILFTARYVKKFHELEDRTKIEHYEPKATSLGEIASYIKVESKILERNGSAPWEIAQMSVQISRQFGLNLPDGLVKRPAFEQTNLLGFSGL